MVTNWTLLLAQVALFSVWPFIIVRTARRTQVGLFQVTVGLLLVTAAVLGAVFALPVASVQVSLGNSAYAAVIMTTVAMFAATRDPRVIRDTIRIVIAVNAFNIGLLAILTGALGLSTTLTPDGVSGNAFFLSIRSTVVGGILHVGQLLLLATVMERTRRAGAHPLVVGGVTVVAYLGALVLDGLAFPALVTLVQPELGTLLSSGPAGVLAKLLVGLLYSVPLMIFLAVHQHAVDPAEGDVDLRGLLFAPRRDLLSAVTDAVSSREASEARLSELVESITDAIAWIDERWQLTYVNETAARTLGQEGDRLVGRSLWEVVPHLAGTPIEDQLRDVARSRSPATLVTDLPLPGRWTEVRIYPSREGLVVYARDVTDRVGAQQRLEQVAAAEQRAAERLREVDQLKNTFLTAVSHELRTPLTVVQGMAETLRRLPDDHLEPELRSELEAALVSNTLRLRDLLDDLLDVDRLIRGVGTVDAADCDVVPLVRGLIDDHPLRPRVTLSAPPSLAAHLDSSRVERIVANLLDNAAKYAPQGPIEVTLQPVGSDRLLLQVADHGPGVPPEELERIFTAFHRVDEEHPQPGTGIGLALVREFAHLHGGRAWAVDTGGRGAQICVELPRRFAAAVR